MTEDKEKEYILFVKTSPFKYAPVERTFSSYLEALNFFNKHREMWGAGPKDYIIKSTAELKREAEFREQRHQQRKRMIQPFKTLIKSLSKTSFRVPSFKPVKVTIPTARYGITYSTIYKQPIITISPIKVKTRAIPVEPPTQKPSLEEEEEEEENGMDEA